MSSLIDVEGVEKETYDSEEEEVQCRCAA